MARALSAFSGVVDNTAEYTPSPEAILLAQRAAEQKRKGFTDDQIRKLRIKCKYDLFFLATGILNYNKLSVNLHGSLCAWLERHRDVQYRLILLPRSHYKSTIVTISDSIQTALPDDAGVALYPYDLGTNVRICLAHDIAEMAQKFLRIITQQFCTNPLLIALFPECVPNTKLNRINSKELELPRTAVWAESTFDTMAVGARGQGNHYNKLKLDDIYGESARDSQSERESHIQWFDNIQSFLLTPKTDQIDLVGTRWAFDDVYAHAMKVYTGQMLKYIRSVYEKSVDGVRVPIFPEQFSLESLEILKKNKIVWNAQYINNPSEGATKFQPEWKRFYARVGRNVEITNAKTFLNDGSTEEVSYEELDRLVLVDPAIEGLSGIVVTGTDRKKRVFILEAIKKSLQPEQLRDLIFSLVAKYTPRLVAIEDVLFSALFEPWFRTEMAVRGIRFRVEPVKTGQKEKPLRVMGLANFFEAGQIFFHPSQEELIEEYDQFGATEDYHMLDALAYGPRLWRAGFRSFGGQTPVVEESNRNIRTGYSRI